MALKSKVRKDTQHKQVKYMKLSCFKKAVCLILIVVFVFTLCSCNISGQSFFTDKDNDLADARMEQVYNAIENQDIDALVALFSEKAIMQTNNIYSVAESLFSFIQGEPVSWSRDESPIVFDWSEEYGNRKQLITWFTLLTEEQSYSVFLVDYPVDSIEPQKEGLYSLRIIKIDNEDYLEETWEEWVTPGIYIWDN